MILASVPPCERWEREGKGYEPVGMLRSLRAEMAFSAENGGVQLQADSGSWMKSLYLLIHISKSVKLN